MADKTKFAGATITAAGYAVKDVRWNACAGAYLGRVADPMRDVPYTCATWNASGHCRNSERPDCNLVRP